MDSTYTNDILVNNVFSPRKKLGVEDKKVLVALSGGVDSSVAAVLLKEQGYQVEGAYMVCWTTGPYCTTQKDRTDAVRVSSHLGIPFRVFDFEKEYKKTVIDYFFSEYEAGRTPNPDVMCNKEIKFGLFLKKALELGFDYIATGHYARIKKYQARLPDGQVSSIPASPRLRRASKYQEGDGNSRSSSRYCLLTGIDSDKDQSYFLYTLNQEQLKKSLFPIGEYTKEEVRRIAASLGLLTASKPDSQGICFVGPVNIANFLRETIKKKPGNVIDYTGKILGKHDGLAFYTIGQREGVGVSKSVPYYVAKKKQETNELVVAPLGSEKLYESVLEATQPTWTDGVKPEVGDRIKARIRYRQPLVPALIENIQKNKVEVRFDEEQKAVTPGQSVVFYKELDSLRSGDLEGEEVLGGATISG